MIDTSNSPFLTRRIHAESDLLSDIRLPFHRDRDRIMHSRAFRRLMHKTQIFNANIGDHYRNRLTHTLEVSQIARSIGYFLKLNDSLIEAIALGHDVGHTPYGHIGERTLNNILRGGIVAGIENQHDGFKHNLQSLRVVDELETRCHDYNGINLTLAVREGIIKHTKVKKDNFLVQDSNNNYSDMNLDNPFSFTFEGQVVALADEIAQYTHDLEDSVRSGIISIEDVISFPLIKDLLERRGITEYTKQFPADPAFHLRTIVIHDYIDLLIRDVISTSQPLISSYCDKYQPQFTHADDTIKESCIKLSVNVAKQAEEIYKELKNKVIMSEAISIADSKSEYVISQLFKAFYKHPKQLPDYVLIRYFSKKGSKLNRLTMNDEEIKSDSYFIRCICDHIAGMTDQFASREYKRLYLPE